MLNERVWINQQHWHDPLQHEQTKMLKELLYIVLFFGALLTLLFLRISSPAERLNILIAAGLIEITLILALVILQRGLLMASVTLTNVGLTLGGLFLMLPTGLEGSRAILLLFVTPILLSGLVVSSGMLWLSAAMAIFAVISLLALELRMPWLAGFDVRTYDPLLTFITFAFFIACIALITDHFGQTLRKNIARLQHREQQLQQIHASLEKRVEERTVALRQALHEMAMQAQAQAQLLAEVEAQRTIIRQLSVPLLPVDAKTMVMPLVGALDAERMQIMQHEALTALERLHMQRLLIDLTGVPVIDVTIAQDLFKVVQAARLLGCEVVLIGIRPEVAQTIVALGINFADVPVARDLVSAVWRA